MNHDSLIGLVKKEKSKKLPNALGIAYSIQEKIFSIWVLKYCQLKLHLQQKKHTSFMIFVSPTKVINVFTK